MTQNKVKIVCTLGPASLKRDVLSEIIDAGMNVARLNFSHGTYESHEKALELLHSVAEEKKAPVAVMLDTKGPEIRTTLLENGTPVELVQGETFELRPDDGTPGNSHGVGITHPTLGNECKPGDDVFIDDGTIHLKIRQIREGVLICEVIVGGMLAEKKGINIPQAETTLPILSERDREDILWGVEHDVDFIAISFVRDRNDVLAVRKVVEEAGGDIRLIAKIESRKAVERLDEIADVVDGMMVARGDLGVEIPTEDVPLVQKRVIEICRLCGKPTIVATQMLDSMIRNPRPTRAEANDVANAVLDGADAVMLSGESAAGKYPVRAVQTMARIVNRVVPELPLWRRPVDIVTEQNSVPDGVSMAAVEIAGKMKARGIVSLTRSGSTARMVSKYRPDCPVFAVTPSEKTCRLLSLYWGVFPVLCEEGSSEEEAISLAVNRLLALGYVDKGDMLIITAGMPLGVSGSTNMLRVHTFGRIAVRGLPVLPGVVTGRAFVAKEPADLASLKKGDVLIMSRTSRDAVPFLDRVAALVTEEGGLTSHAAIVSLELGIPAIVGAAGASKALKTGNLITVDSKTGVVYEGNVNAGA